MNNKYALIDLEPNIDTTPGLLHGGSDIIFGWTPIEIPTGACLIKTLSGTIEGTDGAAGNNIDMYLYFARSVDGVAPSSFGTENAVTVKATTLAFRKNLLGFVNLDMSSIYDGDALRAYSVLGSRTGIGSTSSDPEFASQMLQGDLKYPSTRGYQTIWVAGYGTGTFNFGTACLLNQSAQAASVPAVQITTDGTDPRNCFAAGDILIGATGGPTMEVVSTDSATTMTVKNVSEVIDDSEELVVRTPIKLRIGLEY